MLFRTETVMALLLLGFRPVIADIDTVWLHDPVRSVVTQCLLAIIPIFTFL